MTFTLSWQEITALLGIIGIINTINALFVDSRITKSNNDLLTRINGTYVRSSRDNCPTGDEMVRRLETLEDLHTAGSTHLGSRPHHSRG